MNAIEEILRQSLEMECKVSDEWTEFLQHHSRSEVLGLIVNIGRENSKKFLEIYENASYCLIARNRIRLLLNPTKFVLKIIDEDLASYAKDISKLHKFDSDEVFEFAQNYTRQFASQSTHEQIEGFIHNQKSLSPLQFDENPELANKIMNWIKNGAQFPKVTTPQILSESDKERLGNAFFNRSEEAAERWWNLGYLIVPMQITGNSLVYLDAAKEAYIFGNRIAVYVLCRTILEDTINSIIEKFTLRFDVNRLLKEDNIKRKSDGHKELSNPTFLIK
jgi:hypothetical protein